MHSPLVARQAPLATTVGSLVVNIVRERGGYMSWHAYYPGALAALLGDGSAQEALAMLEMQVAAWEAAKDQPGTVVKGMAQRSAFNSTYMQWVIGLAKVANFKQVAGQMKEMIATLSKGWGLSRLVGKANQCLRDAGIRDSASKIMKMVSLWHTPIRAGLIGQFDRQEVQPLAATAPGQLTMQLFSRDFAEQVAKHCKEEGGASDKQEVQGEEFVKKFKHILGRKDRSSFTPLSAQGLVAEMHLIQHHHAGGQWDKAADTWRARLVPEGQLVASGQSGEVLIAVGSYECAWLGWPAKEVTKGYFTWDPCVEDLVWRFCFDLEAFKVLPSAFVSPIHAHLAGNGMKAGTWWQQTAEALPLLEWHCAHGFPGVPEAPLKAVISKHFKLTVPGREGPGYKKLLVLAIMEHMHPEWTQEQATHALQLGVPQENPDGMLDMGVNDEMLCDVVLASERQAVKDYVNQARHAATKRTEAKAEVKQLVTEVSSFKPAMVKKRKTSQIAPQWHGPDSAQVADVHAFIIQHGPPRGAVSYDHSNGRWFLTYNFPGMSQRMSISWARRGHKLAASLVLHQLWTWHSECTGVQPCFQIGDLLPSSRPS